MIQTKKSYILVFLIIGALLVSGCTVPPSPIETTSTTTAPPTTTTTTLPPTIIDVVVTSISSSPSFATINQTVNFTAQIRNAGNVNVTFSENWNFGDGTGVGSAGPMILSPGGVLLRAASHSYNTLGLRTVIYNVTATGDVNLTNNVRTLLINVTI